jgi:hypothetical protein
MRGIPQRERARVFGEAAGGACLGEERVATAMLKKADRQASSG